MSRFFFLLCAVVLMAGVSSDVAAERLLSMKIGATWPHQWSGGGTTGEAQIHYGAVIDRKVGLGVSGNFIWNVKGDEVEVESGRYKAINDQRLYMFPVMGFIMLDPLPDLVVHPVAHFQVGYNSMIYHYTGIEKVSDAENKPVSPYFYGLIIKTGIDGVYDIGEMSALVVGVECRWSEVKTRSTDDGIYNRRDMGGISLGCGLRVFLP